MNTGQVISGLGHLGLIGWMFFGGNFQAEPLPFEVTDVAVVSEAEFEAMLAGSNAPDTVTEVAMPAAPAADTPPEIDTSPAADTPPEQTPPEDVAETAPPDDAPEPIAPVPEPQEVQDRPPEIAPPAEEEIAILTPERSPRPQERPVDRVAPEPVAQPPEPEAAPDPVRRPETSDTPAEEQRPDDEATAPQEAVTEITPEADDEVSAAPARSVRPRTRPQRPAQTETAETETAETGSPDRSNAVNDALAAALGGEETGSTQAGAGSDPLTQGEQDALVLAMEQCWSVDPYAASGKVTVIVRVELNKDGSLAATPKFISATGGDQTAIDVAFRNARTAVISCGRRGFDLPEEKYEQWREIDMVFNPEKMRLE